MEHLPELIITLIACSILFWAVLHSFDADIPGIDMDAFWKEVIEHDLKDKNNE